MKYKFPISDKDYLELSERHEIAHTTIRTMHEDIIFYLTALNLSGKKEELLAQAEKLIEKHGILKGLKESRKTEE